jgi:hypothetical protein
MATLEEITKVFGALSLSYPNYIKDADAKNTITIYAELLADIPGDVLRAAAKQHIASSKFFPTIAELRQLALSIAIAALPERTGVEAWGLVVDTFASGGYYRYEDGHDVTPEFDDPLITATVKGMGGYWHLYGCIRDPHGNPAADRARFIDCYEALKRRQRDDAMLLPGTVALRQQIAAAHNGNGTPLLTDGEYNENGPRSIGTIMRNMGFQR